MNRKQEPSIISVPSTIDEAVNQLVTLNALVTANEWERAAIVYAFTGVPELVQHESMRQFARRKIAGLKSKTTVVYYCNRWKQLVSEDASYDIGPGDSIPYPDIPWKNETVDRAILDEALSELGKIHAINRTVQTKLADIDDDDQRLELAETVRKLVDKLTLLAMDIDEGTNSDAME